MPDLVLSGYFESAIVPGLAVARTVVDFIGSY